MNGPIAVATAAGVTSFPDPGDPGALGRLLAGDGVWEIELGFGKGRFLLGRATARPERRFLGIEVASEYFRLAAQRLARRGLSNLVLLHGEALAILATLLPPGFATAVHVYFPDPWPKSRHHKRRLFAPASVDLVLRALAPGGELFFATDHLEYGNEVRRLLETHPAVRVRERSGGWPDGARTNYEAKFVAAGRPILRLEVDLIAPPGPHPEGAAEVAVALAPRSALEEEPRR